ncbi:hypothetical protein [Methanomethylovorans sp.]|uniref:hypothetical protein n=1 Tax=Methanomethylovorans sp. TaxID=2758717 RepID=UPI003D0FA2C4
MSGYANPSANSNVSLFKEFPGQTSKQYFQWWLKPVTILVSMLLLTSMLSSMFSGLAGIAGARGSLLSDPSGSSGVPDSLKALLTIGAATFIGGCAENPMDDITTEAQKATGAKDADPYGTNNPLYEKALSSYDKIEQQQAEQSGEQPDGVIDIEKLTWPREIPRPDGTTQMMTEEEFLGLSFPELMIPRGDGSYDLGLMKFKFDLIGYDTHILFPEGPENDFIIDGHGRTPEISGGVSGRFTYMDSVFTEGYYPVFNQAFVDKYKGAASFSRDNRDIESKIFVRVTSDTLKDYKPLEFQDPVFKDASHIIEIIPDSGLYIWVSPVPITGFKPDGSISTQLDSAGDFAKKDGNIELGFDIQVKD